MNREIGKENTSCREDRELVEAFQANREGVFDKLVLKYKDKVFNLCYRFLGDYEEANDCAQEVFVKLYRSLKKFQQKSSFSTWLYRITVNTCKNKLASSEYRLRKKMVRLDNPIHSEKGTYRIEIEDETLSPATQLDRKEKEMLIQNAIGSLPEEQKMVVLLRDVEGFSYEKITVITGYNIGTVKSKLARARQKLREKLRGLI
ncbi:MAG TPA: sigma-70 family RNA polymerase sigma factor [Candidatus Omnitrophica bacterium]|nr:sigma-70 family RNA polymerase sigma factor [Candidatus Omnitrophota bacterium]